MSIDENATVKAAPDQELPDYLPPDPAQFYAAGPEGMPPPAIIADEQQVLERLGPPPFPKGKFPFVGFLAGVYEHVSQRASTRINAAQHEVLANDMEVDAPSEIGEILPIEE